GFLGAEIYEFAHYIIEYDFNFPSSAFGSGFFALVGFHGGHVLFGICWLTTLLIRNAKRGLNLYNAPKLNTFSLYWHFIDVVWVFMFTVVYLMGKVGYSMSADMPPSTEAQTFNKQTSNEQIKRTSNLLSSTYTYHYIPSAAQ